ncbi:hypothetical protein [Leeuwenhoekiella aestuarii]|nr:hypothetical protein [Leeuwenhoekiella aestuarii]
MKHQQLYITDLNPGWYLSPSGTVDAIRSKEYMRFYTGELLKIYTLPDTIDPNAEPQPENTIYKILNFNGLKITGDLSSGLSTENIQQTPEDKAIIEYKDSLETYFKKLNQIEQSTFNYRDYLEINKNLFNYIDTTLDDVRDLWVKITYAELAARQGFLSQEYFAESIFWPSDDDRLNKRMSKADIHTVRGLPPISINNEIKSYLLSEKYDENPFFEKGNKPVLKIMITDSYSDNEKYILEELMSNLKVKFGNAIHILKVPANNSYIDFKKLFIQSMHETLLDGRESRGYTQVDALQTTILDKDNKVLLNTKADEYLENQIQGILDYLENQHTSSL